MIQAMRQHIVYMQLVVHAMLQHIYYNQLVVQANQQHCVANWQRYVATRHLFDVLHLHKK
ncbi:MAG: hypothetical protein QG657_222 [Acidobacteriota bacterium]|nr:hypothetical protein [Acidobacteriota bacterium]